MRKSALAAAILGIAHIGCQAPECEEQDSTSAFHIGLAYETGIPDLTVTVTAESGSYTLSALDPWPIGYVAILDVEWGGDESDGTVGTYVVTADGHMPVYRELTAAVDDDGCPRTQHDNATF